MVYTVEFELVTPERLIVSTTASMVVIPGEEGDFGVLPSHTPVISILRPGVIDIHNEGKIERKIFVSGGSIEMIDDRCTVLADEAIPLEEMDELSVSKRLEVAREALEAISVDDSSRPRVEEQLLIAQALKESLQQASISPHK